ncbi:50S ribosomal protein L24 [Magnetospirillum gryphiswaldense]|jgi:large subunit ribosomal protein L24|uniref:Large ribosomal subunit protein uL24 n=2 Tax=Magnetospirillum gryphiswaldense TaxID=55518 RepID=V6EVR6_MAGGM|nr:50S ribosomal protein L24 [Magnetospirillum gryphiswaldense]KAF0223873.1 MAG: large subunit ribosomal protein [Rhodospirillaceae bacterium]TNC95678.1 MAG: large subunit ribosomal protein L24 [Stygiobacter sp.]AVM72589.1 50S ribosomal protein L24 [Magnetospirillum gryphiswaldense MSR-1]AVM76492.1 50S ribosomal protein L24 [Magnetospirillum gryphiswaldense]CAM77759.1 50S Ribosomal protein L24 [Magnetospirillum gryphiswaldense MSR-1]
MAGLNVKKGDQVVVIAGKDKGKKGEVIAAYPKEERVVVQGVNKVKRHVRPSAANAGGIVEQEAALHVSNVAHVDPKDGKPTRVGVKVLEDGRKVRVAKRSGEVIDR